MRLFLLFIFFSEWAWSQTLKNDSVYSIPEVIIKGNRGDVFTPGSRRLEIDSIHLMNYKTQNLGDLLAFKSNIFIKNYGPGSLSTISFRGTSPSHTAILWNGFNMQAPSLGLVDLAILPMQFVDQLQIQHGGAAALFGSGAVGGYLRIDNKPFFKSGTQINVFGRMASYHAMQWGFTLKQGFKNYSCSWRFFSDKAQNNFPFINTAQFGSPKMYLKHAATNQQGLMQENYFKINTYQQVNLCFWLQRYGRELPPNMLNFDSKADLSGLIGRMSSQWSRVKDRQSTLARVALFSENMDYFDDLSQVASNTNFATAISELENKWELSENQQLNMGLNYTFNRVYALGKNAASGNSEGYARQKQHRTAFFSSYKHLFFNQKLNLVMSLRQEFIADHLSPLIPAFSACFNLSKGLYLKGQVSKNFRYPTFNDLYWKPGGNINLKAENGWSQEAGLGGKIAHGKWVIGYESTAFNSKIDNWIIWLPANSYWSPQNILLVQSRGVENSINLGFDHQNLSISASANHTYLNTTNQKTSLVNDHAVGKQLIYVPQNNLNASVTIRYKQLVVSLDHNYTGLRFVSSDNSSFLPAFNATNLSLSQNVSWQKRMFTLQVKINNLSNQSYQVMQYRPMPPRNYQLAFFINLNKS